MTEPTHVVLQQIRNLNDVYDQFARQLELPADFGRNLDALHDVLSGSVAGPVVITWRGCLQSLPLLGQDQFDNLLGVLNEVAGERSDLEVRLA
ncbi:barstar family protein [Chitiniphilus eburneus]|uniref:Barnase inhibitor n=1 Tax=Chitiniphilus eburneus TaxID=2571148 RepID=A0A4U0PCF6_9NEIS|nr:barstar family protein [Chitiniphilus eburneus]TJZ65426.1 barnase inhibitor [Chitiniphilus eburneus]